MPILAELKNILIEPLGIDDETVITPDASFVKDLGADSLDLVELIMTMEEKFGIRIPDEDAERLITVQDAVDYLVERGISNE